MAGLDHSSLGCRFRDIPREMPDQSSGRSPCGTVSAAWEVSGRARSPNRSHRAARPLGRRQLGSMRACSSWQTSSWPPPTRRVSSARCGERSPGQGRETNSAASCPPHIEPHRETAARWRRGKRGQPAWQQCLSPRFYCFKLTLRTTSTAEIGCSALVSKPGVATCLQRTSPRCCKSVGA
jgi:hypothetical protein